MTVDIAIPAWAWVAFCGAVAVMLGLDLFTLRGEHATSKRRVLAWTILWVGVGIGFAVPVGLLWGGPAAEEYLAAYAMEKSLSLDNLFLFLVIFRTLRIPASEQHHVLFWGIFGAVLFRALFVFLGAEALERWDWVSWVFAGILLVAAVRAVREDPASIHESAMVAFLARHLPVSNAADATTFVVREDGRLKFTRLALALIAVELTDIAFAIDSVPAALSMTRERFLVYTSNIFAILGLRALYLLLSHAIGELRYLHYGLAAVLAFAGIKLVIDEWTHLPGWASVLIVVGMVGTSVVASVVANRREARR